MFERMIESVKLFSLKISFKKKNHCFDINENKTKQEIPSLGTGTKVLPHSDWSTGLLTERRGDKRELATSRQNYFLIFEQPFAIFVLLYFSISNVVLVCVKPICFCRRSKSWSLKRYQTYNQIELLLISCPPIMHF